MNKRTTNIIYAFFVLSLFAITEANGQVMEWMIQPSYKDIVYLGNDLYKVKGFNDKWGIFNTIKGELTVPAEYENISPIVEDRILILDAQGERLYGIVDKQGYPVATLIPANQKPDIVVMKDYPYYSDGLLVVGHPAGQYYNYGYVDKQGNQKIKLKYLYACPFNHGQAMVYTTEGTYQIIDQEGNFSYKGNKRIAFMSNPQNGIFVLATKDNRISKVRLEASNFKELEVIEKGQTVHVDNATFYKNIYSTGPNAKNYNFDNAFHYIEGSAPSVVSPIKTMVESSGKLKKQKGGWLYGISYNNEQVLPEQFKAVKVFDDEYAVVTMENNSVGLLRINPSGKISLDTSSTSIEFAHHQEISIPVNVTCGNMMSRPEIELAIVDGNQNRTFRCIGSGQVQIPFYEAHNQIGEETSKTMEIEMKANNLKLGRKSINITSSHQAGFMINIGRFPTYSDKRGVATVYVSISSVGGAPSESAMAIINGAKHSFNGMTQLSVPVHFSIATGQIKNCSVSVTVTENGCPSVSSSKNGTVKSYSLQ